MSKHGKKTSSTRSKLAVGAVAVAVALGGASAAQAVSARSHHGAGATSTPTTSTATTTSTSTTTAATATTTTTTTTTATGGSVTAAVETAPVPHTGDAADDMAVWVHPTDPAQSTVIGTDKAGGLAVYDLSGKQLAYYADSRPNNVDIRYNFPLGGKKVALVVTSDRATDALRTYAVDPTTRELHDVSARTLSAGIGLAGLCMYRSPSSGKYYVFDSDSSGTLQQWELYDNGGKVDARKVRQISTGSVAEGCVADDETGAFYLAEEDVAIWRYAAEPTGGSTRTKVDGVGDGRLTADIEGLSIYYGTGGTGYLLASSQGSDTFVAYDRKAPNAPVKTFRVQAGTVDGVTHTDGIDVLSTPLGASFPEGVFLAQDNSNDVGNQNFKLVPWGSVARSGSTALLIDKGWDPRTVGATDAPATGGTTGTSETPAPVQTTAPAPVETTTSPVDTTSPAGTTGAVDTQSPAPTGPAYYVDAVAGNDASDGRSPQTAWKSLSKANSVVLAPGTSLLLARGSSWSGSLKPSGSGSDTAPATIGAFGTGARPVIRGASTCVSIAGNHVVVRDLEARACSWAGIGVAGSGDTIENSVVTDTAAGVYLKLGAQDNKVLHNDIVGNNRMSVLTASPTNDDSGAFGVLLKGDRNEIAYNRISGSDAFSYDYGRDGSAVEVDGGIGNQVHHNTAVDNDAFTELGGSRAADNVFAYNDVRSSLATSIFAVTRGAGSSYGPVLRTKLLNNTVLLTGASSQGFVCHAGCSADILTMRNNIIQAVAKVGYADAPFDEGADVYYGGKAQFTMSSSSRVAAPGFVDAAGGNLRLTATSVAVDRGVAVPYDRDLDGLSSPVDGNGDGIVATDIGAYERR